jgi:hypothetical protein
MFSTIVFASSLLAHVSASSAPSTTWLESQRSAIVKLPTPGYPLWLMDKAKAPILQSQSADFYWEQDKPSAVLLNLTMSHDNKTLLLNHQAILPMANSLTPPKIEAYQVSANTTEKQIAGLASQGLFNGQWDGLTLSLRFLALDYDRLVWSDPESGPYMNNQPVLKLRILGLGAHKRSDVLDAEQQMVMHVTLTDLNHGMSDAPEASYRIMNIEFKTLERTYDYVPALEPKQKECTRWSWSCADEGLYANGGGRTSAYRFIWRSRFDEHGRIGSLRHSVFRKMSVLKDVWEDAGPAMMMSYGIVMGPILLFLVAVMVYKRFVKQKGDQIKMSDAFDDSLLGEEGFGEKYVDIEDVDEVPPPLPPRPARREEKLVDLEAGDVL